MVMELGWDMGMGMNMGGCLGMEMERDMEGCLGMDMDLEAALEGAGHTAHTDATCEEDIWAVCAQPDSGVSSIPPSTRAPSCMLRREVGAMHVALVTTTDGILLAHWHMDMDPPQHMEVPEGDSHPPTVPSAQRASHARDYEAGTQHSGSTMTMSGIHHGRSTHCEPPHKGMTGRLYVQRLVRGCDGIHRSIRARGGVCSDKQWGIGMRMRMTIGMILRGRGRRMNLRRWGGEWGIWDSGRILIGM